jgi:hypothetical protein
VPVGGDRPHVGRVGGGPRPARGAADGLAGVRPEVRAAAARAILRVPQAPVLPRARRPAAAEPEAGGPASRRGAHLDGGAALGAGRVKADPRASRPGQALPVAGGLDGESPGCANDLLRLSPGPPTEIGH